MEQALVIDAIRPHRSPLDFTQVKSEFLEDITLEQIEQDNKMGTTWAPYFGARVSCGLFGISDDYIQKYQSLDSRFIKNKASTFFFEAASNSMEPLIMEGDVLVVDRSLEVVSGRVAVVCLAGEMLCKRVFIKSGKMILRSDNKSYKDVNVTEEMDLLVFGVVTSIAREVL